MRPPLASTPEPRGSQRFQETGGDAGGLVQRIAFGAGMIFLGLGVATGLARMTSLHGGLMPPSQDALSLARRHAAAGEWGRAAAEYAAEHGINHQSWRSVFPLAAALERDGDVDGGAAALRRVARARPYDVDVHVRLAGLLTRAGRLAPAVEVMDHVLEIDAGDAQHHVRRAGLLLRLGKPDGAIVDYAAATELDPALAGAWLGLGAARLSRREFESAERAFARALVLDPTLYSAHNGIGTIHRERGDYAGAREAFRAALAIEPDDAVTRRNLREAEGLLRTRGRTR